MKPLYVASLLGCLITAPVHASILKSGSFYDYTLELKNQTFSEDSGDYVSPSVSQRNDFSNLAISLFDHNWVDAEVQANALGYDLVQFHNTTTNDTYWGVTEQLVNGEQTKGWGSYFINENATTNVTVQVTHPVNDTNTHRLGARVFERSGANAFAMAGAHRSANGSQTANPTSLPFSIFQEVHEVFNGGYGDSTAWQLHGFGSSTRAKFPSRTDAVLSDGAGNVTKELLSLDKFLDDIAGKYFGNSYVYNSLDIDDPLNIQVNGIGQDGHDPFYRLRAFNNPQGQFSREAGGTFVHIEASHIVRFSRYRRDTLFANAVVAAIRETSTGQAKHVVTVPEPNTTFAFAFGIGGLLLFRKKAGK